MRPYVVHWLAGALPSWAAEAVAPTWFTCVGLAGLVALFWMLALARRHRLDRSAIAAVVLWCYLAAVTAGIVVPLAIDLVEQAMTGRVVMRWAGMTSFWGYLGGLAAVTVVCRLHRLPLARLGDLAAAPLGGALVLARLGCFLAGCDYGKVSSLPWAMRFPAGSPAWHDELADGFVAADRGESLPVHPTQLYEAALGAAIIAVACLVSRTRWARRGHGRTFLAAAVLYAVGRLVIEDLRGDASRGVFFGVSSAQIFSLAVLAAIAGGCLVRRRSRLTAATAALAIAVAAPGSADAQPASAQPLPPPPYGSQPYGPQPAPSAAPPPAAPPPAGPPVAPAPGDPYGRGLAPTSAVPPDAAAPRADEPAVSSLHGGLLVGLATPLNRRSDQVPMLGGPSISLGVTRGSTGAWLDFDSFANTDASHGTVLLSGSFLAPVANHLQVGARAGFGATLVNFKDPAFRDVTGATVRFEALAEYSIGASWDVWLRPLSFDLLSASALGGPILTWQVRIGVAYHLPVGGARPAPPPAPRPPPPAGP